MVLADSAIRGLGIGTSVKGIIAHGINTTVVELDPGVHDLAIKYFDLPPNHTAVIQNAVPFVNKAAAVATERYDYIIHDVFTGGAEPVSLFTLEFLTDLRTLLKDDGVVAIVSIHLCYPTMRYPRVDWLIPVKELRRRCCPSLDTHRLPHHPHRLSKLPPLP